MQSKVFLILLFCFTVASCIGQEIGDTLRFTLPITQFTTLDGLPSNETYDALIDKESYLWITTDKGVSRYNGYEFENYTTADGLIDNTIFQMCNLSHFRTVLN